MPEAVIIICCIFIPPLGVYFVKGDIDNDFWINLVLSILCWIPGVIHALIIYSRNK
ncbi:MAG: YqaE/Pmp3 family membrane protein [Bacteroidetes bacterium]|nr:YqaE/Pmp3 family membrane protein [Bacteroidota bacterium]